MSTTTDRRSDYWIIKKQHPAVMLFCIVKPLARRVVQKSLSEEEEIKTPFAIIKVRSANCI